MIRSSLPISPTLCAGALAALVLAATSSAHATTYTLEPDYTQGVFSWVHLGFSSPSAQFSQGRGTLDFDPVNPAQAKVNVTIQIRNVTSGVSALDDHLQSKDFFEMVKFPTATFASTKVDTLDAGKLRVHGSFTIHGVTKPVTLDVTLLKVGTNPRTGVATVGFDATTTFKRSDFGLGAYVPQVGDTIHVRLTTQAAEAKGYAAFLKAQAEAEAAEAAKNKKN